MAASSSFISQEEFNLFHAIDRELYTHLVINLWRDPLESMQIMALLIWLERTGFNNVVKKILSLPYILVNDLADEVVTCLNCINDDQFMFLSEPYDIPLLHSLMEKEISLQIFHENRVNATQGVAKIMNDVCVRALTDIMQQAIERNAAQNIADSQIISSPAFQQSMVHSTFLHMGLGRGDLVQPWTRENVVPPDDRTMFVTFSKGYPVFEWELRSFFTSTYGNCIETLYMQEVQPDEQSLFSRIVFYSASTIGVILGGMDKAKFSINGKHVWARKFVPKRSKSSQPPVLTPPPPPPPPPPFNLPAAF